MRSRHASLRDGSPLPKRRDAVATEHGGAPLHDGKRRDAVATEHGGGLATPHYTMETPCRNGENWRPPHYSLCDGSHSPRGRGCPRHVPYTMEPPLPQRDAVATEHGGVLAVATEHLSLLDQFPAFAHADDRVYALPQGIHVLYEHFRRCVAPGMRDVGHAMISQYHRAGL